MSLGTRLSVLFGVKSADLEEARFWVEAATGVTGEARESSQRGGDYYRFPAFDLATCECEYMKLMSNRDIYDGEPVCEAPARWRLALEVEYTRRDSPALRGLERDTTHFKKLRETSW